MNKKDIHSQDLTQEEKKEYKKKQRVFRFLTAAALLLILFVIVFRMMPKNIPLEESDIFQADEVQELAEHTVLLLGEGNYEEIQEYASEDMISVLTKEQMDAVKEQFAPDWGEFQSFGNLYMAEVRQKGVRSAVVQMNASYEHTSITYTVSFDENMQLIGLWMK